MEQIFNTTIKILKNSLDSIDIGRFEKLLDKSEAALRMEHKIVVSGLGKNVPICDKFVGIMISMGLTANFLHTNSAIHGDLGMVKPGDLIMILTKSGSTKESIYLAEILKKRQDIDLWLLTYKKSSPLVEMIGKENNIILDLEYEGDLWNVMPNNSTTLNLIVLQTLAMKLAGRLGLVLEKDFKPNHPGGAIREMSDQWKI